MTDQSSTQKSESKEIRKSDPIDFPAGLPGFETHRQFNLESRSDMRPFLLLRSMTDSEVALPLIDCQLLRASARPELTDSAAKLLGAKDAGDVAPFFVLKVDAGSGTITVNTKAPILITAENSQGFQVILDSGNLKVDEPLTNLLPEAKGS